MPRRTQPGFYASVSRYTENTILDSANATNLFGINDFRKSLIRIPFLRRLAGYQWFVKRNIANRKVTASSSVEGSRLSRLRRRLLSLRQRGG